MNSHPLALIICCLSVLAAPAAGEDSGAGAALKKAPAEDAFPELFIAEPNYDWGTAFRGETIRHTFSVANSGKTTLVIQEVKPQCGCTLATDYKSSLAPGESTEITLTLETGALTGSKQKHTEIISNALTEDNKLLMGGEIVDLFTLDPKMPRVEAILATTRERPPAQLRLEQNIDRDVQIREVRSKEGRLETTFGSLQKQKGYLVSMQPRLDGQTDTAFQKDSLQLDVDVDGKSVQLSFPVTIALRNRIVVNPSKSVHFSRKETAGLLSADAPGEKSADAPAKTLELRSLGDPDHRFKITAVEAESKLFQTELETVAEGKHYRLKIILPRRPDGKKRFVKDKIRVKTDDPEVPLLVIPAMAQFSKSK
jgi:hypothetical protein